VTGARNTFGGYDELFKDATYSKTFEDEGVFPYFCQLHPGMVGVVIVGDGVPGGDEAALTATRAPDGGSSSAGTLAAIAAAIGLGGAALGMAGTRVLAARGRV
jgi:hypothetical protein